ncbi:uncharacterized protein BO87DRAFT_107374 [Aspergillus neoniger CBS 115656]|uniref:Uncharacterized protein n=1 Tax=Aspergillus neoniger (strain CBS 115656) TaxID=1448310 RepID=A0A318Z5W8_ASPNB|nr:hypothetical protein BO87DRAFT_107374 [Aspergillus neoniger CBS 115656]PYH32342.1 hypothetical protein BO87DRAFT_107374 [Aspergillus neoniger CBS 115656]
MPILFLLNYFSFFHFSLPTLCWDSLAPSHWIHFHRIRTRKYKVHRDDLQLTILLLIILISFIIFFFLCPPRFCFRVCHPLFPRCARINACRLVSDSTRVPFPSVDRYHCLLLFLLHIIISCSAAFFHWLCFSTDEGLAVTSPPVTSHSSAMAAADPSHCRTHPLSLAYWIGILEPSCGKL